MILINSGFMKMEYLSGTNRFYVYRSTSSNIALFQEEHTALVKSHVSKSLHIRILCIKYLLTLYRKASLPFTPNSFGLGNSPLS